MLLWLIPRNDGSGILDDEARDGDPIQVKPDSWEPNIGNQEKKSFLIIKVPDPPNLNAVMQAVERAEFEIGQNGQPVIKRYRRYRVDWRSKLSASERAIVEDANAVLPDGALSGGGSVANGVVSGLFTANDLIRK